MNKIVIIFFFVLLIVGCEAGDFTPQRNRLHNMGREGICENNPSRCIDGTNIDW